MPRPDLNYQQIFDRQEVPEEFRGPEHYHFHTVTEFESPEHAGETYAIPREIHYREDPESYPDGPVETYEHMKNGAIIHADTIVEPGVTFDGRAVVKARLLKGRTHIGWASVVGWKAGLADVRVGGAVTIGPRSVIDAAKIGDHTTIGEAVEVHASAVPTVIGANVTLEDHVRLMGNNVVGSDSSVYWGARLDENATTGKQVQVDDEAIIGRGAKLEDRSRVMAKVTVPRGKRIKPDTIVVPSHFRKAKRGH
jgi:UDP-3-O-[3-hydroxymyristoyl] glucosamine N-acyltransferase